MAVEQVCHLVYRVAAVTQVPLGYRVFPDLVISGHMGHRPTGSHFGSSLAKAHDQSVSSPSYATGMDAVRFAGCCSSRRLFLYHYPTLAGLADHMPSLTVWVNLSRIFVVRVAVRIGFVSAQECLQSVLFTLLAPCKSATFWSC